MPNFPTVKVICVPYCHPTKGDVLHAIPITLEFNSLQSLDIVLRKGKTGSVVPLKCIYQRDGCPPDTDASPIDSEQKMFNTLASNIPVRISWPDPSGSSIYITSVDLFPISLVESFTVLENNL